jgi:putative tryptophan/tyrosine transport system substrate-binding protein
MPPPAVHTIPIADPSSATIGEPDIPPTMPSTASAIHSGPPLCFTLQRNQRSSSDRLELLKQIAPRMTRVAVLRDSVTTVGIGQLAAIQGVAPSFGVELTPLVVRDPGEIEPAFAAFGRGLNGGLIVTIGTLAQAHRDLIITLAARHRLVAVYPFRMFVTNGGLISYGPDPADQFRRAAGYVDRILKGEKPAELPVQQPTKVELVINLKTAKALGLEVPPTLLARADEVIE